MSETASSLRCSACGRLFPAGALGCPDHGPTLLETDPLLGRVLGGRYRLERCVGKGGMGAVYDARHLTTDARVAVKVLAQHLSKDLKLVARFRREAMAAARLDHESCVQVHDFGEDDDGTFYIVMELVDGVGLGDELRRIGPLPGERVARIGVQLLAALEAAHDAGVLHRDLKPQNIMITQKAGRPDLVKVVDFGIAKLIGGADMGGTLDDPTFDDQMALTLPGTIFGTPEYMSPEQARGETLDPRSDLYSAAVVLWHLLLGRSPFRGKTVRETLLKVFTEQPPRPSAERPGAIPAGLEDVLLRALAKDPARRFPDARSFRQTLAPFAPAVGLFETATREPLPGLAAGGKPPPETLGPDESAAPPRAATLLSHGASAEPLAAADGLSPSAPSAVTLQVSEEAGAPAGNAPEPARQTPPASPPPDAETAPPNAESSPVSAGLSPPEALQGPQTDDRSEPVFPYRGVPWPVLGLLGALALVGGGAVGAGLWWLTTGGSPASRDPTSVSAPPTQERAVAPATGAPANPQLDAPPNPGAREAALQTAQQALEEGRIEAARAGFEAALRADPNDARGHANLATLAFQQGDLVTAQRHLERAMALDERYARQLVGIHAIVRAKLASEGEGGVSGTPP